MSLVEKRQELSCRIAKKIQKMSTFSETTLAAIGACLGVAMIIGATVNPESYHQSSYVTLKKHSKMLVAETPQEELLEEVLEQQAFVPAVAADPVFHSYETAFGPEVPDFMGVHQRELMVTPGDTLMDLLMAAGAERQDAYNAVEAMKAVYSPRKIRVGQEVQVELGARKVNEKAELRNMMLEVSPLKRVEIRKEEGKFTAHTKEKVVDTNVARARGVINSSFYQAMQDGGLSAKTIMELMNAYSYDVDFQRDIKSGQKIEVLFEQHMDDQEQVIAQGNIKYAAFHMGERKLEIYRYEDSEGNVGYYHPNGESVRTALLKTPVNGARISSGFGMRRHPVLGYSKMHKGMDFAAPTGTPVYAAGDGVVQKAKRWGGYGNYLRIKHNGTYETAYAHLHRFAKGVRPGKRVKQGQVVAYVGSTGRSTGPHLHYEILKNGKQTNPKGVKFKTGRRLKGKELASFNEQKNEWQNMLASLSPIQTQVALASQ